MCHQACQEYSIVEWRMLEVHNQTDGVKNMLKKLLHLTNSDQFHLTSDESVCLCVEPNMKPIITKYVFTIITVLMIIANYYIMTRYRPTSYIYTIHVATYS